MLFVVDGDEQGATQIQARFGETVGDSVKVESGIKPGDRVIVSDMSAYSLYPRIELHYRSADFCPGL
jgi:hypothetical protein